MTLIKTMLVVPGALMAVVGGCGANVRESPDDLWPSGDLGRGAEGAAEPCGPSNCVGCCREGTCVQGNEKQLCGVAGRTCRACMFDQVCLGGFCSEHPCSAASCAGGCCDVNGRCRAGTSGDACGAGGETCGSCGSDQVCLQGGCVPRGGSTYRVTLVSALITGGDRGTCGVMELWGACDPYVILKVGQSRATSSVKANNNAPVWDEFMLHANEADLTRGIDVEVRDHDPIGSAELGRCRPALTPTHLDQGRYVHPCGDVKELTWQIDPV